VAQGVPGRLRPQIILTFRHYKGGRSSAKHTGRFYPRRNPWYSLSGAESTPGHMVLSGVPWEKSLVTPPGIDPGTVRLVAQRLNRHTTPGTNLYMPILISQEMTLHVSWLCFVSGPHKPGSTRRMIGSPRQLENAVPTSKNPHGVWV